MKLLWKKWRLYLSKTIKNISFYLEETPEVFSATHQEKKLDLLTSANEFGPQNMCKHVQAEVPHPRMAGPRMAGPASRHWSLFGIACARTCLPILG
jgi:hypothetical protein